MMRVGLTGGIGSGKSTVAGFFQELGVPVYNSDSRARELMEENDQLRKAVSGLLGPEAYLGPALNRQHIASKVFKDKTLLGRLNVLVHPVVRKDFLAWAEQQKAPYILQEAAILFENGAYRAFDAMILVTAPEETRIQRVMERDSVSRESVAERLKNQWETSRKIPLADYVIENLDLENTRREVGRIHRELLQLSGLEPSR
ncbi:MAG: dephospho-CoA kinase [Flavobacteriaceae bacterium]|nr:MAG: dephospho-CoA kinase [Flavobacteriaceae bacterium]